MDLPRHPFWDFSLRVYAGDGVARACVALQDDHGLNVNLLLFCGWAGSLGRVLGGEELRRALAAVAAWDGEVVGALRRLRRRLKAPFDGFPARRTEALRGAMMALERDAEHIEQLRLAAAVPLTAAPDVAPAACLARAAGNLARYVNETGAVFTADDHDRLATLLAACFPHCARPAVERALAAALAPAYPGQRS